MRRLWLMVGMLALMLVSGRSPLHAQAEDAAYQEALRRIQAAGQSNASELDLSGLNLTALPPEIGHLAQLSTLNLFDNQLTALPPEISQLTRLFYI